MKKKLVPLLILTMLIWLESTSQSIKIVDVETSEFPLIQILIESGGKAKINFRELKISENKEELNFSIDSSISIAPQNLICLLIDNNIPAKNSHLNKILNQFQFKREQQSNSDLFNIVISKSTDETTSCITPVSYEFTQDTKGLIKYYRNSYFTRHIEKPTEDLSCPIDSLINFINTKNIKITNKFLFVFKSSSTTCSDFNILKAKAEANLINLQSFNLNNQPDSSSSENGSETLAVITSIIDSSKTSFNSSNSYLLSYYTSQTGSNNDFLIQYNSENIQGSFSNPKNELLSASFWLSIIVFLLVLFTIFYVYSRNRFKKSLVTENKSKQKKVVKVKKKTEGTSITPSLTINFDEKTEIFELKKIRTTIGRHSDNDILVPHLTISNHHAIITNEGGVFYIQDNKSTNGVFVNDIKITKSKLSNGDNIRMGIAKLLLDY